LKPTEQPTDGRPFATSAKRFERMLAILDLLATSGSLPLTMLAATLQVSAATIRRDLAELEDQALLRRTHGGASVIETEVELPERLKNTQSREAKKLIARRVAQLVPTGRHVVALSGGTTTAEVARMISTRHDSIVVTNSLTIAALLAPRPKLQLIMTGGIARAHSFELVGFFAERSFQAINIGTAILGTDGITASGGATTYDETEARTNLAMVTRAERVIVVADGSKVGKSTFAQVASAAMIHDLVTDSSADEHELELIREAGVRVHVVELSRTPSGGAS
jgi:DeoR family transcriptional regulator of aga operon